MTHEHDNRTPFNFCPACGHSLERERRFGKERPVCPQCGRIHFFDPKVAAGVLVQEADRVLLVKRRYQPEQGKWALPAGFVDAGEDPRVAAARECAEETGFQVQVGELVQVLYGVEHHAGADLMLVYRATISGGQLDPQDDASDAAFFSAGQLPPLAFRSTRRVLSDWREQA